MNRTSFRNHQIPYINMLPSGRPERAAPVCAEHRIRKVTSPAELRAVAQLCSQEFSSTSLSNNLETSAALSQFVGVARQFEQTMANQAVKDLLKRFLELENRKQAGKVRPLSSFKQILNALQGQMRKL